MWTTAFSTPAVIVTRIISLLHQWLKMLHKWVKMMGDNSDTFLWLDVQRVGNLKEPSCLYSLATILFGTELWGQNMSPLLIDIAHATINRKDIYSLLNKAMWPQTWIPVSECNSISLKIWCQQTHDSDYHILYDTLMFSNSISHLIQPNSQQGQD